MQLEWKDAASCHINLTVYALRLSNTKIQKSHVLHINFSKFLLTVKTHNDIEPYHVFCYRSQTPRTKEIYAEEKYES